MEYDMWEDLFPGVRKKEHEIFEKQKRESLKMLHNNEKNLHKSDTLIILTVEHYYYPEETMPEVVKELNKIYLGKHFISYIFYPDGKYKQPHKIIEINDDLCFIYRRCEIIENAPLIEEHKMKFSSDYLDSFNDKYKNIIMYIINLQEHIENWKKIIYYENPLSLCYIKKIK